VGDREVENDSVAVRTREGEDLGVMTVDQLIEKVKYEIASHAESVAPSS
jgi:threonyl-tRNA synthetase